MVLVGLNVAMNRTGRDEGSLVALALAGELQVWRDSNGSLYFDSGELRTLLERPAILETQEVSRALFDLVGEPEDRTGSVWAAASWRHVDRQAEKLGTPETWAEVEAKALERAWADLMAGTYAERVRARLPRSLLVTRAQQEEALRAAEKAVQSPLVAVVKPARGRPRSQAWALKDQVVALHEASVSVPEQAQVLGVSEASIYRFRRSLGLRWAAKTNRRVS